jgi:hypothetical protein
MHRMIFCILLCSLALPGQTTQDIAGLAPAVSKTLLTAGSANDAVTQGLADSILSLAIRTHQPTRQEAADFANALRGAAAGRADDESQISILTRCILDILRSRGLSNFALAAQVRAALTALQVSGQKVDVAVQRFIAIGQSVRGPDAVPAKLADPIGPMTFSPPK